MPKITLKDIAEEANVSTALASYVLNGRHLDRIKKETAERIREVAKRLNYHPNYFAKGLKTQKSNIVGLILTDLANPFSTQLARIIEDELNKFGYNVLIGSTDEQGEKLKELVEIFTSRQVDGLIIMPTENSEEEIAQLHKTGFPYILIDRYFPDAEFNFVVNDNHFSTYSATRQLIKNGRKKIGFISFETNLFHIAERKRGFTEACEEAGIDPKVMIREVRLGHLEKDTFEGIAHLVQAHTNLDALLFSTNTLALFGLKYLIRYESDLKSTIELMAIDEADFYDIFPNPINYYKQPLEEMGEKAVQFLVSKIGSDKPVFIREVIKGQLVSGNRG